MTRRAAAGRKPRVLWAHFGCNGHIAFVSQIRPQSWMDPYGEAVKFVEAPRRKAKAKARKAARRKA